MKKAITILMAFLIMVMPTGCSSSSKDSTKKDTSSSTQTTPEKPKELIEPSKINYEISEGIIDDERSVMISFTNNTKYDILSIEMIFKKKADVTDEQMNIFQDDIDEGNINTEDLEDLEIDSYRIGVIKPDETINNIQLELVAFPFSNIKKMDLVEADHMDIEYIDSDLIRSVTYDFKTNKVTYNNSREKINWPDNKFTKKLPEPFDKVLKVDVSTHKLSGTMFDVSRDDFNKYVELCKKKGFTNVTKDYSSDYNAEFSAENKDGYSLTLYYYNSNNSMSIHLQD